MLCLYNSVCFMCFVLFIHEDDGPVRVLVIQGTEKLEGVAARITGIEENDLVPVGTVVLLVAVQETTRAEVRIDITDSVEEDIGAD